MYDCDICYNSLLTINVLKCCKDKHMCLKCRNKYGKQTCPFCRQNMNRKTAIVIINNQYPCPVKGEIIMSVMNYNIVKIW
jgi:hypothetical protein